MKAALISLLIVVAPIRRFCQSTTDAAAGSSHNGRSDIIAKFSTDDSITICAHGGVHSDREKLSECLECGRFVCLDSSCYCPCPVVDDDSENLVESEPVADFVTEILNAS